MGRQVADDVAGKVHHLMLAQLEASLVRVDAKPVAVAQLGVIG